MAFIASKTLGFLILPSNVLFIALISGLALLWLGKRKWGLRLATGATVLLVFLGLFPVGSWLIEPLETRFPPLKTLPADIDGIIVLGGAVDRYITQRWGQPSLRGSAERMTVTVVLSRRYPNAKILFTGGIGSISQSGPPESMAARQFFLEQGMDMSRLIIEDNSRNTYENAILTKNLIKPGQDERWLLITSAYHMPRSVGCFRKAGWKIIPYPVDFKTSGREWSDWRLYMAGSIAGADFGTRAWVGLIAYYLMDRTSELFPSPEKTG